MLEAAAPSLLATVMVLPQNHKMTIQICCVPWIRQARKPQVFTGAEPMLPKFCEKKKEPEADATA